MTHHETATRSHSKAHPKLFIGTGNVFTPEKFNADGIAAFVKEGFSGTNADYHTYKENPTQNVKVYEYIYGGQNQSVIDVCKHPSIRLANRIKRCS